MKRTLMFLVSLFLFISIYADEGMWLLKELNAQSKARMKELGFEFPLDSIYSDTNPSLKDAVVIFGGGCTGVAVSDKGLIFTNHHCGYDDIQKLSSVKHDYLKDGFASHSNEKELPAPGLTVSFLDRMEDITERVLSHIGYSNDEKTRLAKIDSLSQSILEAFDHDPYIKVNIVPFYTNNKYYLVSYKVFHDVRLVFTPPSSVGKFGGETDNWMWPRHTGDFSVFRVYANAKNEPSGYNENNVPYTPKYSVPISLKGYKESDYAMTIGYPGRTERYMSSWGIDQMVESDHKPRIEVRGVKQDIWREAMNADDATRIKYASKYAISSNYWKNAMGMNEAIDKLNIIDKKEVLESDFSKWISKKKDRKKRYENTLQMMKNGYGNTQDDMKLFTYFIETFYNGIEIIRIAKTYEQVLNDDYDKEENIRSRMTDIYKDYDAKLDQNVTAALMELYYKSVPKEYHPSIYTKIYDEFDNNFNLYADWLFKNSEFCDIDEGIDLTINDSDNVLSDPAMELTQSLEPVFEKIAAKLQKNSVNIKQGSREFMAGLIEMNPQSNFYPDANFTQRLSYGSIGGYTPSDAVKYNYYSTSKGVLEKETEDDPEFNVQSDILDQINSNNFGHYADKDGTMHVNFLSNNDISGEIPEALSLMVRPTSLVWHLTVTGKPLVEIFYSIQAFNVV